MTSSRWWTTGYAYIDILYLPYTLMTVSYVIIGGLLPENPRIDILLWVILGWFIAVGVVSHSIDERKGHPLNTGLSDKTLKNMAILGLIICGAIAIMLAIYYTWITIPLFLILAFVLIIYNAELFSGRFHRDMVFTLGFAVLPMLISYYAVTLEIPDLSSFIFILGVSATASIETVVNHFVKFNSEDFHTAYDKNFAYLQRSIWATVFIVYMIAISLIIKRFV